MRRTHQTTRKLLRRLRTILKTRHGIYGKAVQNLEEWFNAFDKDHDGQISIAEFSQALKRMDLGLTEEQIKHVIQEIDANNDGLDDKTGNPVASNRGDGQGQNTTAPQQTPAPVDIKALASEIKKLGPDAVKDAKNLLAA